MSSSGSTISGSIFLDLNADGLLDGADSGVGGQTVQLLSSSGTVVATTTTLGDGTYSFTGVAAGSYTVQASAPSGESFSPVDTGYTGPYAASVVGATGKTPVITVSPGIDATNQNAGVYAPVSFSGTVFTDSNDNGLVDGTDTGKAGVTVQLLGANGSPTGQTTTTAANGTYSFTNLTPGTYSAQVVLPTLPPGAQFSPMGSNTTPQPTGGTATAAQNLLTNGSFEPASTFTTTQGFAGWTESTNTASTPYGGGPGHGVELALTNGTTATAIDPTGATNPYAGVVSPDNANPNYLGGSGTHAAFFVDDDAVETLSQTVTLQAGQTYEVGFDLDETTPGQNNPGFFQLSAAVNGQTIVTAGSTAGTILKAGTWTHFADLYTATATGSYTLTFTYQSGVPGSTLASKDVLVDDVYIVPGQVTTTLTTTSEVNANGVTTPVTLTSGQTVGNESAGIYFPPATISGTVFTDANADGIKEAGDAGLTGRTVNLTSGGTIVATAVTDANGNYSFTNQAAGTYTVTVVAPSGGKFSAAGASASLPDSTVSTGGTQTVTVASGGTATVNAGIYATGTISGTVFADANADGAKQSTDAGLSGQTVSLLNASGTVVATTTTGAGGTYSFTGQTPGAYTVQVTPPAGDAVSQPGTSTTLLDSTVNSSAAQMIQLTSGGAVSVNAGLYVPATVTGTVFTDANADGAQQGGDAGLAGVKVQLTGSTGAVLATTTTVANGSYSFTGVAPGSDTVQVIAPAGDIVSPTGTSTTLPDSTVNATGSGAVTLTAGSSATVNAGLYAPGTVSGTVFNDVNGDGAQQAGDAGLSGQTVNLVNASGKVIASTTTGSNGSYSFTGVTPGADTVTVAAASGNTFSPAGSSTTLPDSSVSATGSAAAKVAAGGNVTVNAGEYAPSTVSGTVFTDANADGVQQTGDAGLGGQTVSLLNAAGTVIATTATAANGGYSFTAVAPGADTIQVTAPAGDRFSPTGSSTTRPDSTVSATGASSVAVTSGSSSVVNAGVFAPATVTGTIFSDANGDGVKQASDAGVSGQTVTLIAPNGTVAASTVTGSGGAYSFTGVAPGSYTVQTVAPAGDTFSPAGSSTTLPDSSVSTAGSAAITLTSGATATVNAGEFAPSTISGTVFTDVNADGVKEAGDAGLGGQTVNLLGSNGSLLATTTTAADGSYSFAGLPPGSGTVQVVAAAGTVFSPAGASASLPDSIVAANGTLTGTITSGSSVTVNAGEYAPASIGGTVFNDLNGDGLQGSGDAGLAGQTVTLLNGAGASVATTTTNASGGYSFGGLDPASYTVQVTPAAGDHFSTPGSQTVTLGSGASATVNAGEFAASTIGGTVFTDANADGVQQAADAGLGGQTVNLVNGSGQVIATTTTAANGSYSFDGLAPGNDTVQVIAAPGAIVSPNGASASLPDSTVAANGTQAVTVASGSSATANAGEYAPATLGGTVFGDTNGNGTEDGGEAGLAGVSVQLLNAADQPVAGQVAVTDAAGHYMFANLVPGSYAVQAALPAGEFVSPNGAANAAGVTPAVTLSSGQSASQVIGAYAGSTVSGTVFADSNADGAQQGTDAGLGGQTVDLVGASGAVIATATTAADGTYSFGNVAPGNDTIQVLAQAGDRFSPAGTSATLPDSTVTPGGTRAVTVTSGSATTVNAGEYAPATIAGTVFADSNADGAQQPGEAGIAGQTVNLLDGTGHILGTATTAADGSYSFRGVAPGADTVQVVAPAGTLFSAIGSDGTQAVTAVAGGTSTVDAGEFTLATVSGTVFDDSNADGAQQPGEAALSGITVDLVAADGSMVASTVTAADGSYSFTGLQPGASDSVQIVAPPGELFSPAGSDPALVDSTVSATGTQPVTLTSGTALQANAGLYVPAAVAGTVFLDAHYDGLDDLGDPAFSGVSVKLYDADGVFTGQTTTTDAAGHYSFEGLTPGSYQVQFVAPTGSAFTQAHVGSNSTLNSDADPATGFSSVFTLTEGQTDTSHNAGLTLTGGYANQDAQSGSGRLFGGPGDNIIVGGAGSNTIEGGSGTNLIFGGSGPYAQIQGLGTDDIIYGGNGDDLIQGHAGDSFLAAGVGNQTLVGGGGTNTFIANANSGTITDTDGVFTGISGGDMFVTHGNTASIYQAGDGVLTIDDYNASAGDTLQVYGYTAPTAFGQANGYDVLYFGANAAILVRANNTTVSADGMIQGVSFSQAAPAAPLSTVGITAANELTYTLAGAAAPLIGSDAATTMTAAAPFSQDGSFSRLGTGAVAGDVFGVTSAPQTVTDTATSLFAPPTVQPATILATSVTMSGWNNEITVGDGNGTVNAGDGNETVTAGNGNDVITAGGYGNVITVGTGNDQITAGSGATVTAAGGNQTVTLGGYGNLVFLNGTGTSTVGGGMGNDQISTAGGSASITLGGWGNTVTTGGANDTIADGAGTTRFIVGPTQSGLSGGAEIITGFQATDQVTLVNGAAGGQSAAQLYGGLTTDGANTVLSLGAAGSVTFVGLTPSQLQLSNFAVGQGN